MSAHSNNISSDEALNRLKSGNLRYMTSARFGGDISLEVRKKTYNEGQSPFAVIIACSDSRVIPEAIFDCGIGELFVIRVAGNVIGKNQLGSIEYAVSHLGCKLVLVLGHDRCGAVGAALSGDGGGFVKFITDEIKKAVGSETDDAKACELNVKNSVRVIKENLSGDFLCSGAVCHIEDGKVEFI